MTKTIAMSALLLAGAAAFAETNIQSVTTAKTENGGYQVVIKGNELSAPKVMRAMKDTIFIAEFDGWLRTVHGRKNVNVAGIKSLQYGWYSAKPPKVRFVLRLNNGSVTPKVDEIEGGFTITVAGTKVVTKTPTEPAIFKKKEETKNGVVVPPDLPYPKEVNPIVRSGAKAATDSTKWLNITTPIIAVNDRQVGETVLDDMNSETTRIRNAKTGETETITRRDNAVKVSLDFVGTDIIQILKALSIQSNVNIVSSPDVSPEDEPAEADGFFG